MDHRPSNLLDEALGSCDGRFVLIEDSVETSGAFVLHHLIKRFLITPNTPSAAAAIVFVALARPFSHYDRVLRKLGCNLSVHRQNNKFIFVNAFFPDKKSDSYSIKKKGCRDSLISLYAKIRSAVEADGSPEVRRNHVTVMIDDASLLEVAADGCCNHVTDFLHYCHTLTSDFGCSLVVLNHKDIYSCVEGRTPLLQMEYLADLIIRVEPLSTGLAADVHGQLTVINKGLWDEKKSSRLNNFHFKVKENCTDYFYPGSQV
uniref:Elongator complex protein 6 n=1 Tax=Kalanchoe fedtschenkoi TaxID=63787 RepID=A0A7N0ZVL4_KALFE